MPIPAVPFITPTCLSLSIVRPKTRISESISLNDLAATLRENKQHLYSYTSKQEIRESTVTDPETGEETTVSGNMDGLYCPLQR